MSIVCYDSDNKVLKRLYQWDTNQTMIVEGASTTPVPVFHFCNRLSNKALVVTPTLVDGRLEVDIPNILLQQTDSIIVYMYEETLSDGSRTMHTIHIPVVPRPQPSDYEYVENISYPSYALLSARLSTLLASLTDEDAGSTTEVTDIRIGYDGTVYDSAGDAVRAIGEELGQIREELEQYIDAHAVDGLYYADSMLYLTSKGEIVSDPVEIVSGGGSGGSSSIVRLINNNETTSMAVAAGGDMNLQFTFTSIEDEVPTGNGTLKITVGGVTKLTTSIAQGLNTVNVKDYLAVGTNNVRVTCTDVYGLSRSIVYTITVVELKITSTFDDTVTYDGDITFKYTPYGLIEKTVHIKLDGTELDAVTITASGKQSTKIIPAQTHGVHRLDVYLTASLEGSAMESDHLIFDVMCVSSGTTTAFIASPFTAGIISQGEQVSIPYTVYDPASLSSDITLNIYTMENGSRVNYSSQPITVDRTRKYWVTRRYPVGTVYFEIAYPSKSLAATHIFTVNEASINVSAETNDLELYLTSAGRSNNEATPAVWSNNGVTTTFTNVNWSSSGWVEDENGDVALRLNGDARATINFQPFNKDIRTNGKTIEIEYAIRDVNNRDAVVIDCLSGGIGIKATADTAWLDSEQSHVECRYKENEKIRVAFVVESRSEYRMLAVYLNGVLSQAEQYPTTDNFQQSAPVFISLGSQYCGIDIYTVRVYDTALPETSVKENYIADIADISKKVEVFNNNDIYDDYDNLSYEKIKPKIPVMTIVGTLPQSKGDKKTVQIIYEDPFHPELNFTDNCTIDVQGTSSQFYVRKNWKLKFGTPHIHAVGQLPAKVFCMKVDYAEATGTHNTQNANLIETLYSEPVPAQEADSSVRTTIYGFPCVIFSQANSTAQPIFYGKANFNYDKGAENVYGFTSDYDVESWEFCNNTSDACNFIGEIPSNWGDDFEARYPDGSKNITRFKQMHDWVVSTNQNAATGNTLSATETIDGVVYTTDTAAYRLAKFKAEFEDHFDMHYSLIYYVYTFVALMVDQRAKNMFMTYWGGTVNKWYPYFYDNDTSFGINNEGKLVFDYYHEDTDTVDGANVYNGQNSVLWTNFRLAFADEIKETYQDLRSSGKLTYEVLVDRFITNGSDMWSESIYNEDAVFKYISMLHSDNDASNLYQVRGDGELHFKYIADNRLQYCDSKWYAPAYADDIVSLRIYTPSVTDETDEVTAAVINGTVAAVTPDANITVTPYSKMYAGVRYKANGTLQQARAEKNVETTFEAPDETFNDTETAIYGASNLSSLGDLAPLYCGTINVAKATKLVTLKIGDSTEGYANPNLTELSVGTNRLLKTIDIRNCPNLTAPVDLSGCPNIETIYAEGSGITGVELPDSGYIKTLHLPATVKNLTLKNQEYINDFVFTPTALKTLWIENCPTIDAVEIIESARELERVRLTDVDWSIDSVEFLRSLYGYAGIDENGANIDFIHVSGDCHITTLTGSEMAEVVDKFPYLNITYTNLSATITFKSEDGNTTLATATVLNGGDATYTGSTPNKTDTAQYDYTFDGWSLTVGGAKDSNALKNVSTDRIVYAHFSSSIRYYNVTFVVNGETAYTTSVPYGGTAVYNGAPPVSSENPEWEFSGWNPSPVNITGTRTCNAVFVNPNGLENKTWAEISQISAEGNAANFFAVGDCKSVALSGTMGTLELDTTLYVYILGFDHNSALEGTGIHFGTFKDALTNGKNICLVNEYNTYKTDGSKIFNMNHWGNSNRGGWAACDMRYDILGSTDVAPSGYGSSKSSSSVGYDATATCATNPVANTLMSCLPTDLRAVMKPMTKYTDNVGGGSGHVEANVTASVDYLPLLGEMEIFGAGSGYNNNCEDAKQAQYAYFANGNSKVKYQHSATGSTAYWWERSPYYNYSFSFCYVYSSGSAHYSNANYSYGVAPAFKI